MGSPQESDQQVTPPAASATGAIPKQQAAPAVKAPADSASDVSADVAVRIVHGVADRFAYFVTGTVERVRDNADGTPEAYTEEIESIQYVTRESSFVPADRVDDIIASAASVGVVIQKVEED